jgi:hypothetical protein
MQHSFASSVNLVVNKKPANMGNVEAYLLETLVSEWRKEHEKASNESHRGNVRLEKYLKDNEYGVLDVEDMSERMKNLIQYGMAEGMR